MASELQEAKSPAKTAPKVVFHHCDEFNKTFKHHIINSPGVDAAFSEFRKQKSIDPMQKFGSKDYKLGNHFDKGVPGLLHAGLTHDKSIFYTISGSGDTRHIHLYGIYGHDEAGIGQPGNINKQKSLSKKLSNQDFE